MNGWMAARQSTVGPRLGSMLAACAACSMGAMGSMGCSGEAPPPVPSASSEGPSRAPEEPEGDEATHKEGPAGIIDGAIDTGDPGVVLVRMAGDGFCTGEIVSPHVVTTAAHCVKGESGWTVDTTFDGTGVRHAVKEAHYHPSYTGALGRYDVAVVIVNDALAIKPIALNHRALQNSDIGKSVRIVGYGDSTLDGKGYGKRRQATVKLVSFRNTSVTIGNVGADGKVQCYGDSGGPALLAIDGVEMIIGFDSGNTSEICNKNDLNTRADMVTSFIDPYIKKFN